MCDRVEELFEKRWIYRSTFGLYGCSKGIEMWQGRNTDIRLRIRIF